jgi:8-oxo-dGTP pyrophosphatase MutT (NUDIX family)
MAEVEAIPASSVLLLRDSPLRVLMMHRHEKSAFVPGMWVFPGGAVEETDHRETTLDTMRVAGARETFEETGIWLGDETRLFRRDATLEELMHQAPLDWTRLVWTSHWITPIGIPMRFDTWFFLIAVHDAVIDAVPNRESLEMRWIEPREALRLHSSNEMPMVFPTVKNLEAIEAFDSAAELIASRHGATIEPVQPRLVIDDGRKKIVLP